MNGVFLHLGRNVSVRIADVVSIHDIRLFTTAGAPGGDLLARARVDGSVIDAAREKETKSVIITEKRIYLSAISPVTLMRRARQANRYVREAVRIDRS